MSSLDEIIINFVRDNPCFYDKRNVDFKNTKKKDLWEIISDDFKTLYDIDMSADAVEKRWSSLRDMFNREHRKQKLSPSGSGYNSIKEWELYRVMLFLTPHIAHRRTKTSLSLSCPTESCPIESCPTESEIEENNFSLSGKHLSISNSSTTVNHDYSGNEESMIATNMQNEPNTHIEIFSRPSSALSTYSSSSSSQFLTTTSTSSNSQNLRSSFSFKPIKKAMPEPDTFAKRR